MERNRDSCKSYRCEKAQFLAETPSGCNLFKQEELEETRKQLQERNEKISELKDSIVQKQAVCPVVHIYSFEFSLEMQFFRSYHIWARSCFALIE